MTTKPRGRCRGRQVAGRVDGGRAGDRGGRTGSAAPVVGHEHAEATARRLVGVAPATAEQAAQRRVPPCRVEVGDDQRRWTGADRRRRGSAPSTAPSRAGRAESSAGGCGPGRRAPRHRRAGTPWRSPSGAGRPSASRRRPADACSTGPGRRRRSPRRGGGGGDTPSRPGRRAAPLMRRVHLAECDHVGALAEHRGGERGSCAWCSRTAGWRAARSAHGSPTRCDGPPSQRRGTTTDTVPATATSAAMVSGQFDHTRPTIATSTLSPPSTDVSA